MYVYYTDVLNTASKHAIHFGVNQYSCFSNIRLKKVCILKQGNKIYHFFI